MKKLPLLAAVGAGYVAGTRAGRERYEQIKAGATRVKDSGAAQAAARTGTKAVRTTGSAAYDRAYALAGAGCRGVRRRLGYSVSEPPRSTASPTQRPEPPEGPALS